MIRVRVLAIVVALLSGTACNKNRQSMLPHQVAGFWVTDAPAYEGRFLELSEAFVIVGSDPDNFPSVQRIDKVMTDPMQQDLALTIFSSDLDGGHYKLALQFSQANGGEIRFPHQREVWKRYSDKPAQ
jgi:hypothetical protein